jgi:WD repeat-containing protein 55
MCLSNNGNVCASISHDNSVKFWNVENIKNIKLNASSKSKSKSLKNKKITSSGKSENFFADLIDKEDDDDDEEEEDSDDSDDDSEDSSEDED